MTIYLRTVACGKRLFGQHISPQAYRRIAATFLAESSASDALHARPLLGHRRGDTTVHHYIMATSLEASRRVANALGEIRDNLACCRFRGHRDKVLKAKPETGNTEKKIQPRVQA
jgi:hypothetical protein